MLEQRTQAISTINLALLTNKNVPEKVRQGRGGLSLPQEQSSGSPYAYKKVGCRSLRGRKPTHAAKPAIRRGFILEKHIDALTHDDPRTDGFVGPLELFRQSTRREASTPAQDSINLNSSLYGEMAMSFRVYERLPAVEYARRYSSTHERLRAEIGHAFANNNSRPIRQSANARLLVAVFICGALFWMILGWATMH